MPFKGEQLPPNTTLTNRSAPASNQFVNSIDGPEQVRDPNADAQSTIRVNGSTAWEVGQNAAAVTVKLGRHPGLFGVETSAASLNATSPLDPDGPPARDLMRHVIIGTPHNEDQADHPTLLPLMRGLNIKPLWLAGAVQTSTIGYLLHRKPSAQAVDKLRVEEAAYIRGGDQAQGWLDEAPRPSSSARLCVHGDMGRTGPSVYIHDVPLFEQQLGPQAAHLYRTALIIGHHTYDDKGRDPALHAIASWRTRARALGGWTETYPELGIAAPHWPQPVELRMDMTGSVADDATRVGFFIKAGVTAAVLSLPEVVSKLHETIVPNRDNGGYDDNLATVVAIHPVVVDRAWLREAVKAELVAMMAENLHQRLARALPAAARAESTAV